METLTTDLFIIGGGINGTAIAADAAGRGLKVVLCEKSDLASGTSSYSSKLIHGGLRYLELYEFGLVKKALHEREVLMRRAPQLITPLEFVLPHETHLRPAWMIQLGLFLYDHLAKRQILPASSRLNLAADLRGQGLLTHLKKGFSYFDCYTDDAKLVILNALSAQQHKATILTRTEFIAAEPAGQYWKITFKDNITQKISQCLANVIINVAGPWVKQVQEKIQGAGQIDVKLIKGSHFVIPKLYKGNFAYILQNKDQRIIFAIPFENEFTLVGTTDVAYNGSLEDMTISMEETTYLCNSINHYFKKTIQPSDIVWSYAGVRCLQDSSAKPAKITRDYAFDIETIQQLPLLTVISGKLTTHRLLAEEALAQLRFIFPDLKPAWTASSPLPGGDIPQHDFKQFSTQFSLAYPWLPVQVVQRYLKEYGTRIYQLLNDANCLSDLGLEFGHGLYQREVEFLIAHEWAQTTDDILWRRTKLGLYFKADEVEKLDSWLRQYLPNRY